MCKNPVGKFKKHVLTLCVSSSVANAMLQFEFNRTNVDSTYTLMKYDGQLLYTEL